MPAKMTIEKLASMVEKGFNQTDTKMVKGFKEVGERLDNVERRLLNIEAVLIADHKRRIEKLEDQVQYIKDVVRIK